MLRMYIVNVYILQVLFYCRLVDFLFVEGEVAERVVVVDDDDDDVCCI